MATYYLVKTGDHLGKRAKIVNWHGPRKTMPCVECDDGTLLDVTWADLDGPIGEKKETEGTSEQKK